MFEKLLEFISSNFAFHYGNRGAATQITCKEHGIFFMCHGILSENSLPAMTAIGKHLDEKHNTEMLIELTRRS